MTERSCFALYSFCLDAPHHHMKISRPSLLTLLLYEFSSMVPLIYVCVLPFIYTSLYLWFKSLKYYCNQIRRYTITLFLKYRYGALFFLHIL